jgi:hypothetical protein
MAKCTHCNGTGNCVVCGGQGNERCNRCNGTGKDSGGNTCPVCLGAGNQKCTSCVGSGKCHWCNGSGNT